MSPKQQSPLQSRSQPSAVSQPFNIGRLFTALLAVLTVILSAPTDSEVTSTLPIQAIITSLIHP